MAYSAEVVHPFGTNLDRLEGPLRSARIPQRPLRPPRNPSSPPGSPSSTVRCRGDPPSRTPPSTACRTTPELGAPTCNHRKPARGECDRTTRLWATRDAPSPRDETEGDGRARGVGLTALETVRLMPEHPDHPGVSESDVAFELRGSNRDQQCQISRSWNSCSALSKR